MFLDFFYLLKKDGLPVTLHEYLALLEAMDKNVASYNVEDFYYLSRATLIKHESHLDRFDQLFGQYFKGMEAVAKEVFGEIPEDWLKQNLEQFLTQEEMDEIEKMGGLDALMERFKELMEEQKERHEGGNKWIGTGGTSPFGSGGYNPEGFKIGDSKGGARKGVKVWDKRQYANLSDDVELNTRNIKLALKRLRVFTREGIAEELDIDETIRKTSENAGMLDIHMVPSKKNRVKVLMLFDIGGSMDDHIETCEQLFSAAKHEFKHLEYYYFHNCLYESVWKDNKLRGDRIATWDLLHKYNQDYKVIFVGDACMSPYEVVTPGASVEHYNPEAGLTWLQRVREHFPYVSWINPTHISNWQYFESTAIIREAFEHRMWPMTLQGLQQCMKSLKDKKLKFSLPGEEEAA